MSLKLSEKYGLNPTILKCMMCGAETNEIALCGKVTNKDKEEVQMPMHSNVGLCGTCKEFLEEGVGFIADNQDRAIIKFTAVMQMFAKSKSISEILEMKGKFFRVDKRFW